MARIVAYLVEYRMAVFLITTFIFIVGLYSIHNISREMFPNVNLDRVQINVAQPGASPEEIEKLIIIPIEQELKALDGIDKITSVAFPGSARIDIELAVQSFIRAKVVNDIQLAVDRAELPADLPRQPHIVEVDGRVFPIIQLAVSAPRDPLALKLLGDEIETDLVAIPGVARVQRQGNRRVELRVVLDQQKMQQHRVTIGEIAKLLETWNVNLSAGDIDTHEGQKKVRIVGEFSAVDDVTTLVLRANEFGKGIRLADVANVDVTLEKPAIYHDVGGNPALHMLVLKQPNADIIDTVESVRRYLDTVAARYGKDVTVNTFDDFSRFAKLRLGVLTNNAMVGLILVLIILAVFLRPSIAISSTISLPTVVFAGIAFLFMSGITLNMITMMGFIIVLGMLVDDSVVISENIAYHMERGTASAVAAVTAVSELFVPVLTTIATTVVAFLPLLFMSGLIGKFIVGIPIVVIALLIFSLLEAVLFLPSHVTHLAREKRAARDRPTLAKIELGYETVLRFVLNHKWKTVVITIAVLVASLQFARGMNFQLFPPVGVEQYIVRVTAANGTSLDSLRDTLRQVDTVIRDYINPKYLETSVMTTGQTAKDGGDPAIQRGSNFGQIRVIYTPATLRPEHDALEDMFDLLTRLPAAFPNLEFAFEELRPGPPVGRALQAEIDAKHYANAITAANRLIAYLKATPGVTTLESDAREGDREIRVVLNPGMAAYADVDRITVARHLRAAVDGLRVTRTRWGNEEVDITIRMPEESAERQMRQLYDLQVQNRRGSLVKLSAIARFEEHPGFTAIRHRDNNRVINVMASIDSRQITSLALNEQVQREQKVWLGADLADTVQVRYGGENEKNEESIRDLSIAFLFAIVAIFFLLAILFNNLSYPLIVMLAIPFGIIGVVWGFYFNDLLWKPMPLSFMSVIGVIALSGVVVNNSLVMFVFLQRNLKHIADRKEALVSACVRRLRPILITTITTVVGLLPTAYGWGGLDAFVSPLALSIVYGLIGSTVITLFALPAVYLTGVAGRDALHRYVFKRGGN